MVLGKCRGTIDQIWVIRQVLVKVNEYQSSALLCFVDLTEAFDSVDCQALFHVLSQYDVPVGLIQLIEDLYSGTKSLDLHVMAYRMNFLL